MPLPLLPTTVVGSYPQPDWLVDREMLSKVVPRLEAEVQAEGNPHPVHRPGRGVEQDVEGDHLGGRLDGLAAPLAKWTAALPPVLSRVGSTQMRPQGKACNASYRRIQIY